MRTLLICLLLIACGQTARAQNGAPATKSAWSDSRLLSWNRQILGNKKLDALVAVEKDLATNAPHFAASWYWYELTVILGTTDTRLQSLEGTNAGNRLKTPVEIFRSYDEERHYSIAENYPDGEGVNDVMALVHLQWASEQSGNQLACITKALQLEPQLFVSIWNLIDLVQSDYRLHDRVQDLFTTGVLKDSPYADFVLYELEHFPVSHGIDRLEFTERLIAKGHSTPWLFRFRGKSLFTQGRFKEAFASYKEASELLPIHPLNVSAAKCLIRDQQYIEARNFTHKWAEIGTKSAAEAAIRTEAWLANAMRLAGEHGRARDVLKPHQLLNEQPWWRLADRETARPLEIKDGALAKWPDNVTLSEEMARLELADGRHGEAENYARVAFASKPESQSLCKLYIECLRKSGNAIEAIDTWTDYRNHSDDVPSEALFHEVVTSYFDIGDNGIEPALNICVEASESYPDSTWMLGNLGSGFERDREFADATDAYRQAIAIDPDYEYALNHLHSILIALPLERGGGEIAANHAIRNHRDQHPWVKKAWQILANEADNDAERLAVWKRAQKTNPEQAWPWVFPAEHLVARKAWTDARSLLDDMGSDIESRPTSYQAYHAQTRAFFIDHKRMSTRLTPEELRYGLSTCDDLESLGQATDSNYVPALVRCELYSILTDPRNTSAMVEYSRLRPDSSWCWSGAFNRGDAADIGLKRVFSLAFRYVERRPFEGSRIGEVAEKHLQWGGSPLVAAFLYELMSIVDPNEYEKGVSKTRHLKALSAYGASKKHYDFAYRTETDISPSERYIGWYDSARRNAQSVDNEVQLENGPRPRVTITHPDGRVESRTYDPISGRVLKWQIGASWVSCELDGGPKGQLTRIESSSGEWVELKYDSEEISRMTSSSGTQLDFKYNANAQPVQIALAGAGTIFIKYDDDGEILETNTIKDDQATSDQNIALTVSREFQSLLSLSRLFSNLGKAGRLPDLPGDESELNQLRAMSSRLKPNGSEQATYSARNDYGSRLAVAAYMVEHLGDRQHYGAAAWSNLDTILRFASRPKASSESWGRGLYASALELKLKLIRKTRQFGMPSKEFATFLSQAEALRSFPKDGEKHDETAQRVTQEIEESGISLLRAAQWLPKSDLNVRGFWQHYGPREILPDQLVDNGARVQCIHLRHNGEIFVGTTHGLSVYRKGFWHWFGVNLEKRQLDESLPFDQIKAESSVLAITETQIGEETYLWLGSANGLHRVTLNQKTQLLRSWRSESDGLPTPRISVLSQSKGTLFVGTSMGAYTMREAKLHPIEELAGTAISWAKTATTADGLQQMPLTAAGKPSPAVPPNELIFVGTENGVYTVDKSRGQLLLQEPHVADVVWSQHTEETRLYYLQNNRVHSIEFNGTKARGAAILVPAQANIHKSLKVNKLVHLQIDKDHAGIGVLTDLGTSIYFDRHFEHLSPTGLTKQTPTFEDLKTNGRSFAVWSDQGLLTFNREKVQGDIAGPAYSVVTSERLGGTFVARGDRLEFYQIDQTDQEAVIFRKGDIQLVCSDNKGRVYFNDGSLIVRIDQLDQPPTVLFAAMQSEFEGLTRKGPQHLTVTSDETVWASSGASLFAWNERGAPGYTMRETRRLSQTEGPVPPIANAPENSYYLNSKLFPSRTSLVSRVIEGPDQRVFVICSDEKHLQKDGAPLSGGILEWDGKSFERIEIHDDFDTWFMTSYTQVTDGTGIYGSTGGFGRFVDGKFEACQDNKDGGYEQLLEKTDRRLWLGTAGAKLGKDVWLFGTAGGVVGWTDGRWFDPERLNWLLPEDAKAKYGSRHVNDIATNSRGQIFVATDNGLLIYDTGGGGSSDFLMFNNQIDQVVKSVQQEQLNQQRRVLVESYIKRNPESDFAKTWKDFKEVERKQATIEQQLRPGEGLIPGHAGSQAEEADSDRTSSSAASTLDKERARLAIKHNKALLVLNREYPGAISLLQVKPLDVTRVQELLEPSEAVVQYIFDKTHDSPLHIHLIKKGEAQLLKVDVPTGELRERCQAVLSYFASQAAKSRSGLAIEEPTSVKIDWTSELTWLYDQLLRPVCHDLHDVDHVFVVTPNSELRYLPFDALIRKNGRKPHYAVMDHSFSYWPDIGYAVFNTQERPSLLSSQSLVLGDPDGTLPGAKLEAKQVHSTLGSEFPLLLGQDANAANFSKQALDSEIIHLATHAKLDSEKPEDSYLLFSDTKITVPEILFMKLPKSRLAVLSACETGLGANGLECVTLARAFAQAGSPSVIATLWQVNDKASETLMTSFYSELAKVDAEPASSLTEAKRLMVMHPNKSFRTPWMWSGYAMFGAR